MTIDEAIAHAREVAEKNRNFDVIPEKVMATSTFKYNCLKCAEEHEQLAEWLEELKQYRAIGTPEECRAAMEKQKEMIAYCDENDCSDCPFHNTNQKYNKCMNDFIADEIVKGGGVNGKEQSQ